MQVMYANARGVHTQLLERAENARLRGQKHLVLVPEMATLKTEREILDTLHWPGSFDLQVLSPSRLSERVFEHVGMGDIAAKVRIGEQGKMMAVAAALKNCEKELRYYAGAVRRQGFMQQMGQLISDLKRAQVTPEDMDGHISSLPEGAERDKLQDVRRVYAAYQDLLKGAFVDGEDVSDALIEKLSTTLWQKDACVTALGFDVVTGQFARTLCALEMGGREVTLLIRCDEGAAAYAPVVQSVNRLLRLCREQGLACHVRTLPSQPEHVPPELQFVQSRFLRQGVYPHAPNALRLYAGATPYDEMGFVAREILRLHGQGIPFEQMAVAYGSLSGYEGVTETLFASHGIPYYLPRKLSAQSHGAVRFLLSSLRAAAENLDGSHVIDMLRSGYAPLENSMCFRMENYILSYGIRGKGFLSPFTRGDAEECAALEESRLSLITPLETLRQSLRDSRSCRETLSCVFEYLENTGVYAQLMATEELLLSRHLPAQAAQGRQVWGLLCRLMDEMNDLAGHSAMPAQQVIDMLEAGILSSQLSALPPDGGSVMCGEIGSLAGEKVRVLFICNLQDGVMTAPESGMISDEEMHALQAATDSHIALDADGRDDLKLLDFYNTLCLCTEKLYLSRPMASQSGESKRPHLYLGRLRRMLPLLSEEGGVKASEETDSPLSPLTAAEELAHRLYHGHMTDVWQDAWRYLCVQEPHLARTVQQAFFRPNETAPLSREVTKALFLERVMSVSRLETFAACPYQHFVQYGLKPQPRQEWKIESRDAGNFYHSALEGFVRLLPSIPDWPRISKKDCDSWMDQVSAELLHAQFGELMADSARVRAAGDKYRRVLRRVAWTFTKGAQHSAFIPAGGEVRFGYSEENALPPVELTLDNGQKVLLHGVIDRIDRYEGDEGVYLRVVDYKSGNRELNPTQVFYGRQLQLLIYLLAALNGTDAQPAGAYYFPLRDPLIPDPGDLKLAEEKLAEKLHLKGVTLKDAAIVRLMDDATPPVTMPKLLKGDGEFALGKPVAELEELRQLLLHARNTARDLCESMRKGGIEAAPLTEKEQSPCDYCDYAGICRRENCHPRQVESLRFDDLIEKVTHS